MPNPNNNAKMTGDTHLPDVEADLPLQQGGTGMLGADGTPRGRPGDNDAGPGRGINKAGVVKDSDTEAGGGTSGSR